MSLTEEPGERRGLLPRFTSKDANTFLLADALGDIQGSDDLVNDTRMLSRYELKIAGRRPSLHGAAVNQDNTLFTAHLTNRPLPALDENSLPQGAIHIERNRFLCDGCLYEQLKLTSALTGAPQRRAAGARDESVHGETFKPHIEARRIVRAFSASERRKRRPLAISTSTATSAWRGKF